MIRYARTNELLRYISQLTLPIGSAIFFTVAVIYDSIVSYFVLGGLITLNVIVGLFLLYSSRSDYAGSIEIEEFSDGAKRYSLVLYADPEEIDQEKEVIFKVNSAQPHS